MGLMNTFASRLQIYAKPIDGDNRKLHPRNREAGNLPEDEAMETAIL